MSSCPDQYTGDPREQTQVSHPSPHRDREFEVTQSLIGQQRVQQPNEPGGDSTEEWGQECPAGHWLRQPGQPEHTDHDQRVGDAVRDPPFDDIDERGGQDSNGEHPVGDPGDQATDGQGFLDHGRGGRGDGNTGGDARGRQGGQGQRCPRDPGRPFEQTRGQEVNQGCDDSANRNPCNNIHHVHLPRYRFTPGSSSGCHGGRGP
jgi:hypothetical protein